MTNEGGDADGSDQRLRDLVVVIPIAILWVGIPAVILTGLWLAVFVAVEQFTGVDIPAVTIGIVAAAGGTPTIGGVSTFLALVTGLATWGVWFARYGRRGGDSDSAETSIERSREERRWEL